MESADDDEDLKLIKASAALLTDLEDALPKLLWKRAGRGQDYGRVHSQVRQQDLDHVIKLVRNPMYGDHKRLNVSRSNPSKASHSFWTFD